MFVFHALTLTSLDLHFIFGGTLQRIQASLLMTPENGEAKAKAKAEAKARECEADNDT